MTKVLGALLLFGGGAALRQRLLAPKRQCRAALRQLIQALDFLACEIENTRTPMPRLLQKCGFGCYADAFFEKVRCKVFQDGEALAESWEDASQDLPLTRREIEEVASLSAHFHAPAQELSGKIRACVQMMRQQLMYEDRERKDEEKLVTSLCFCGSSLLMILLL